MLDGCGLGHSIVLNDNYIIDRCNHKKNLYVKGNTVIEDVNNKVHNHYSENSFKTFRKAITVKYGIKANTQITTSNKKSIQLYIDESDWLVNYTNKHPNDCLFTIITQISEYFGVTTDND